MKLRKPPYPEVVHTAKYFRIQADHRHLAIKSAMDAIRDTASREVAMTRNDNASNGMTSMARDWAIESLLQGAWIREYHMWERDTKNYFDSQHTRSGGAKVNWRQRVPGSPAQSHVARVKAQLALFSAAVQPEIIAVIDQAREKVNLAKHEAESLTTEAAYRTLVDAVAAFWEALDLQEEFTRVP